MKWIWGDFPLNNIHIPCKSPLDFCLKAKHMPRTNVINILCAGVAELVDAPDLGSGIERCEGSSPFTRTTDHK